MKREHLLRILLVKRFVGAKPSKRAGSCSPRRAMVRGCHLQVGLSLSFPSFPSGYSVPLDLFGFDKVTCTAVSGCSEFSLWTLQSLMDRLQPRSSSPAVPGAVQVLVPLCQTEAFCPTAGKELKELYPHRVLKGFFEGASYCIYICCPMLYKQRL